MRGGKREGAGRPRIDQKRARVQCNITIDPLILKWLRDQPEPQGRMIERALIDFYGLSNLE